MSKRKRLGIHLLIVYSICALLLIGNLILGTVLINSSASEVNKLIRRHILSSADTAAAFVDGDLIASITADDVGGEKFNQVSELLLTIQNSHTEGEIKYIYTVKKADDGRFVFVVDPDPVEPGKFGEPVVHTPEQEIAWGGKSEVDTKKYTDKWGTFYSAWSPVYDSSGKVVALVGVDFDAEWFNKLVGRGSLYNLIICVASLLIGATVVLIITSRLRRKSIFLYTELSNLSENVDALETELGDSKAATVTENPGAPVQKDDIDAMVSNIRTMQDRLKKYIISAREQAYVDAMTGVGNKTAYLEYVKELNEKISSGSAAFSVVIFDINGLKKINDNYGHECGDIIITDAAEAILKVFSEEKIFRIGGDEFIVISSGNDPGKLEGKFASLDRETERMNATDRRYDVGFSLSYGCAAFDKETDSEFREVFKRADEAMYADKLEFYRNPDNVPDTGHKE